MTIHRPLLTRESLGQAHIERRLRMAEHAVPDDGILHPRYRKSSFATHLSVVPEIRRSASPLSIKEKFDIAARKYPLPPPFVPEPLDPGEVAYLIKTGEPLRRDFPLVFQIQKVVSEAFDVAVLDLCSGRRTADIVRPRQIAMYLAKTLTPRSLPEIGRRFGGRDHTTVLHAVRKIEALIKTDQLLAQLIAKLEASINAAVDEMRDKLRNGENVGAAE